MRIMRIVKNMRIMKIMEMTINCEFVDYHESGIEMEGIRHVLLLLLLMLMMMTVDDSD